MRVENLTKLSFVVWSLSGLACLDTVAVSLPCDGHRATLVVLDRGEGRPFEVRAFERCEEVALAPTATSESVFVFAWKDALDDLQLDLRQLNGRRATRPLPRADESWALDATMAFETIDSERRASLRSRLLFPPLDLEACFGRSRCLGTNEEGETDRCGACVQPAAPVAPEPPTLPQLTPCADGFEPVTHHEVELCAPAPPPPDAACEGPLVQWSDASDCEQIGPACPPDGWPPGAGASDAHVDPLAEPGGDGTDEQPHDSIPAALASGATIVLLHSGAYELESLVVPEGVEIRGACTDAIVRSAIRLTDGAALTNLTVRGSIRVEDGAEARLEQVLVEGGPEDGAAVFVFGGARLVARALVVRDAPFGGVRVQGSELEWTRGAVERTPRAMVVVASRAELDSIAVRDARRRGVFGHGLYALDGSEVVARDLSISDVTGNGVTIQHSTGALADVHIRRTTSSTIGVGLSSVSSTLELDRFSASGKPGFAQLTIQGGRVHIRDGWLERPDSEIQSVVWCAEGARCAFERVTVDGGAGTNVAFDAPLDAGFPEIEAHLEDVVLRGVRPRPMPSPDPEPDSEEYDGDYTIGVSGRALVTMQRVLMTDAVFALAHTQRRDLEMTVTATINDLTVRPSLGPESRRFDGVIAIGDGARVRGQRIRVEGSIGYGIRIDQGAAELEDVIVSGTRRAAVYGRSTAETIRIERLAITDSGNSGLLLGKDADMSAKDVSISGVGLGRNVDLGRDCLFSGTGVCVREGFERPRGEETHRLDLRRFVVDDTDLGMYLQDRVFVSDGLLRLSPVGVRFGVVWTEADRFEALRDILFQDVSAVSVEE